MRGSLWKLPGLAVILLALTLVGAGCNETKIIGPSSYGGALPPPGMTCQQATSLATTYTGNPYAWDWVRILCYPPAAPTDTATPTDPPPPPPADTTTDPGNTGCEWHHHRCEKTAAEFSRYAIHY